MLPLAALPFAAKATTENGEIRFEAGEPTLEGWVIEESRPHTFTPSQSAKPMTNRLRFAPTVAAVQVKQNEWRLWGALLASGKYRAQDMLVLVEIATDAGFNQIVHRGKAIASKQNNFAIHYAYRSRHPDTQLFYRFKTIRTNRASDGIHHERKIMLSAIGEMSPWKR